LGLNEETIVVLIAFFLNQHYYGSLRNNMRTSDFLIYATPESEFDQSLYEDCIEFQRQLESTVNESIDEQAMCQKELGKSKRNASTILTNTTR
jgi:hypothetical protein